jgi:crossover junction endodeoxyribonuclease RuvC
MDSVYHMSMVSLGIDPGTRRIGYGVVSGEGSTIGFIAAGILDIKSPDDPGALVETQREMAAIIVKYKPEIVVIEKVYFAKNQKTAIAVAQARGVILLAAKEHKLLIKECTPNEVKLGVAGYGSADKKAVAKMVRLILGKHDLAVIDDASDALAMAILGCNKGD